MANPGFLRIDCRSETRFKHTEIDTPCSQASSPGYVDVNCNGLSYPESWMADACEPIMEKELGMPLVTSYEVPFTALKPLDPRCTLANALSPAGVVFFGGMLRNSNRYGAENCVRRLGEDFEATVRTASQKEPGFEIWTVKKK